MSRPRLKMSGSWIWTSAGGHPFNNFACFRRAIEVRGRATRARLLVTADSRYELYVNGQWVGHGPPRSWPAPWPVDEYEVGHLLAPGRNVLAVLVQHFGIGHFQYIHAEPGLLAQAEWRDEAGEQRLITDESWRARRHDGFARNVPRISLQSGWEEQFDARCAPSGDRDWRGREYDDSDWPQAAVLRPAGQPPHETFEPRDIPMLTREAVEPACVLAAEIVRAAPYTWSLNPRTLLNATDLTADTLLGRLLLVTHIRSDRPQPVQVHQPAGYGSVQWKLNGRPLAFDDRSLQLTDSGVAHGRLRAGWNTLMCRMPEVTHHYWTAVNVWTERAARFAARPNESCPAGQPWLALGPFGDLPPADKLKWVAQRRYVTGERIAPAATGARYERIWARGTLDDGDLSAPFARPMPKACLPPADVFALCASERVAGPAGRFVDDPAALQRDNADWTTIRPAAGGDVRLLLDFAREVVGFHEFEVDAPGGTILDFHNFEFIQRDGRKNLAEGMNNSFRYICREGVQRYRTFVRRGLRYSWLTVRHHHRAVRIRFVRVLMSTYPVTGRGDFACSDGLLERIWHVGAHSVRCCSEDTYTDCPTYEQTLWVGDARNEALVDLVAGGDPRLSAHCWLVAARSLDRSPLVESHVPSGYANILPAWTFLWMRWAQEHYLLTGDRRLAERMLEYLDRNAEGIERHLNRQGLFEIAAWNMFDWAPMDTPSAGVVTHQNCLAVLGLRQTADLARRVGRRDLTRRWTRMADDLAAAINRHLWDARRRAYIDSIHADGRRSDVFSQQTQTAAYISGVPTGPRARRCRQIVQAAPPGFVRAGSPFFMFFVLEGLAREGRWRELVRVIRRYWGVQVEGGATTFWETYHPDAPRLTRSHCHGWSAAPTFFLTQCVLGVRPLEPGYARVLIAPQPGGLSWAQGRVPTPSGDIACRWERRRGVFLLDVSCPRPIPMRVELPVAGRVTVQTGRARTLAREPGPVTLAGSGPRLKVKVESAPVRGGRRG